MTPAWRRVLLPFIPLYSAIVQLKRWMYDQSILSQKHLLHPVISVGSLSAGGAGKTPVVLMLAELLVARGFTVRVLTRGYGRVGKLTEQVSPTGTAAQFGDEPLLLSRRVPDCEIFVGYDRYQAGKLAESKEEKHTNAIYLLDDGLQHQRLARDVEIVLVTRQDLDDRLIPAGNLREPFQSLQRADFVVVRQEESDIVRSLESRVRFKLPPILTIRRTISLPHAQATASKNYLFSGLARPANFAAMLGDLGVSVVAQYNFRDHHRYTDADIEQLIIEANMANATGFVATEKDSVKLTSAMLNRLQTVGPLTVISLNVELLDGASAIDAIVSRFKSNIT